MTEEEAISDAVHAGMDTGCEAGKLIVINQLRTKIKNGEFTSVDQIAKALIVMRHEILHNLLKSI